MQLTTVFYVTSYTSLCLLEIGISYCISILESTHLRHEVCRSGHGVLISLCSLTFWAMSQAHISQVHVLKFLAFCGIIFWVPYRTSANGDHPIAIPNESASLMSWINFIVHCSSYSLNFFYYILLTKSRTHYQKIFCNQINANS